MTLSRELAGRLTAIPVPVQGALYMTAAAFCFSVMNVLIREASAELSPLQIAFFRNFFALVCMLPWLARAGLGSLRTERLGLHVWRALLGLAAMILWFTAISVLPMAEAVALNFTVPLFATVGAVVFLGEIVRARRWSATAFGFLGVLIILRPGFTELTPAMALPIAAALLMACAIMLVKTLSRSEAPFTMVLYMNLILTPLSLIPALLVWRWPSGTVLLLVIALGVLAAVAHIFLTRSFARADASAVTPFDYARLPFVALVAYLIYGEAPDLWTWVGAGVIAGSAIYIARREAQVAKIRKASGAASESARVRP